MVSTCFNSLLYNVDTNSPCLLTHFLGDFSVGPAPVFRNYNLLPSAFRLFYASAPMVSVQYRHNIDTDVGGCPSTRPALLWGLGRSAFRPWFDHSYLCGSFLVLHSYLGLVLAFAGLHSRQLCCHAGSSSPGTQSTSGAWWCSRTGVGRNRQRLCPVPTVRFPKVGTVYPCPGHECVCQG